jgi:beta-galactosidase
VLHLLPHWNWTGKEGQEIDVRCFSNCEEIELLHNGKSLGRKPMVRTSHVAWNVLYEPGVLEAHGYTGGKAIAHARVETTDVPAKLAIAVDRPTLKADGEDVAWVQISALDAKDRLHPTACDLLHFEITGPGKIIGVGNGDPSSHELDHAMYRKLFNGLAMVLIQSERKPGKITLTVKAEGLGEAKLNIETKRAKLRPSLP